MTQTHVFQAFSVPKAGRTLFVVGFCWLGTLFLGALLPHAHAAFPQENPQAAPSQLQPPAPEEPKIAEASNEGQNAISKFKFPGLKCELFAAEPDVANVVAFHRDYSGRMFLCETFRQAKGIEDNRRHRYWLNDDLAAKTVQDRIDYILKHHPEAPQTYTQFDDRIRVLRDVDGDGKADQSTVFANRFNSIASGTGAGVLSYKDQVYYTNIPAVFALQDTDGDDVSDQRKKLHDGYGVHFAYRGHDMHGLIIGPDGRLYFSIGDRGYHLPEQGVKNTHSGAVFRCELDGSNFEVFATGLRNPQELAFDDYGNLFTGDNNSDSGDMARWVYVVPGGDSGWRFFYQYLSDRGPFNREKIWHANEPDVPAYIVPPVENLSDGPSGLEYYPGTGFSNDFDGRFFLCDFRGGPTNSGVRSFRNQSDGAFFKVTDQEQPIWGVLATDIDFGSDGKLYLSDWVLGWFGENRGRIYSFFDENESQSELVKEVQTLLKNGMADLDNTKLLNLASHRDQRVRQEAQFELVNRSQMDALVELAVAGPTELARIHGIWGISQLARLQRNAGQSIDRQTITAAVVQLLQDPAAEIRAQTLKAVQEHQLPVQDAVKKLLADSNLHVRYHAALAAGSIGDSSMLASVSKLLVENADQDPIVRHGGIMAFKAIAQKHGIANLQSLHQHENRSVRIAACVALRALYQSALFQINAPPEERLTELADALSVFLSDTDSDVALEAIRAITDLPIDSHLHLIAALPANVPNSNATIPAAHTDHRVRRIIGANNSLGTRDAAMTLANLAADKTQTTDRRIDAVNLLGKWTQPSSRDYVCGAWRPIDKTGRSIADARTAISSVFDQLIDGPEKLTMASIKTASRLGLSQIGNLMATILLDDDASQSTRITALRAIGKLKDPNLPTLLKKLQSKYDTLPRQLAAVTVEQMAATSPKVAVGLLEQSLQAIDVSTILTGDALAEKQMALRLLGSMSDAGSYQLLKSVVGLLAEEKLAAPLRLDATLAATQRGDDELKKVLEQRQQTLKKSGIPTDQYVDTLVGGNVDKGYKIFRSKTEVSCVRCHRIGKSGGRVGPQLTAIGQQKDARYILEAIVEPNKHIAPGFSQVVVLTDEGLMHTGVVQEETDEQLILIDPDGKVIRVDIDSIEDTKAGKSGMPADLHKELTLVELRDLMAFLCAQKDLAGLHDTPSGGHQ